MKNLEALIQSLEDVQTDSDVNELLNRLPEENSYNWCGIVLFKPISAMHQDIVAYGQIPKTVIGDLAQNNTLYRYCTNNCRAVVASDMLSRNCGLHSEYQQILLVPLKGCASNCGCFITGVKEASTSIIKQLGWYWSILGPYLYDAAQRVSDMKSAKISKRELECIRWASEGKTSWEISRILSIAESTVNFHLANCITKTESVNRQQAIAKCLLQGQLLHV